MGRFVADDKPISQKEGSPSFSMKYGQNAAVTNAKDNSKRAQFRCSETSTLLVTITVQLAP